MKKLIVIVLFVISSFSVINAQFTKIGGGLTYGTGFHFDYETATTDADLLRNSPAGIFLTGIYDLKFPIQFAPSFTFFLPRTNTDSNESTRVSAFMFDLNAHYVFNSADKFEFYGIAGLNITFTNLKWLDASSSESDNALGLNLGAGSYIKITEKLGLYAEAKYLAGKYNQLMINAGFLININTSKKIENTGK